MLDEEGGGLVRCAEAVVPAGTLVALQGGCDQPSGLTRLARQMLRAELGESFVLQRQDFPLYLTLLDADASDRGAAANDEISGNVAGAILGLPSARLANVAAGS